jgi:hypothetical protein
MLSASDENVKDDDCSSSAAAAELKCRMILWHESVDRNLGFIDLMEFLINEWAIFFFAQEKKLVLVKKGFLFTRESEERRHVIRKKKKGFGFTAVA